MYNMYHIRNIIYYIQFIIPEFQNSLYINNVLFIIMYIIRTKNIENLRIQNVQATIW